MTEKELRAYVVETARKYIGCKESDGSHKPIIDLYNSHKPLARSYPLKYTDDWCSGFVSAISIECGLTDILPTEVGCGKHVVLFQKLNSWVENDAYIPQPADVLFYYWSDKGKGDVTNGASHVGIVEKVVGNTIYVVEGNSGQAVKERTIQVNGRYIRGYGVPDYASKADGYVPSNKPAAIYPTLRKGDSNTYVETAQKRLIAHGFALAKFGADGDFGIETYVAVRKFQIAKKLEVDGIIGKETWAALNAKPVNEKKGEAIIPTLRKGAKGDMVRTMQEMLMDAGQSLPRYGADGDFGTETYKALKAFQKQNDLEVDGICGPMTWAALRGA